MTARNGATPRRTGKPREAIVIGGGIAGCTLAYELATRGVDVVLCEQTAIAAESSGRNTGTLLSGPQAEVVELLDACVKIYDELADGPIPFGFGKIGHLLIAGEEALLAATAETAERMTAVGVGVQAVTGAELARDYPRLGFKVAGGYFVDRAWTLEPLAATHAFAHAAREAGAQIKTGCRIAQVFTRGGKVQGVLTDDGILPADLVFIANGIWMPDLLRRVVGGEPLPRLPFAAGRGWIIQLGLLGFELPWIVEELSWPDQTELGRRLAVGGLPGLAAGQDDQPTVEAICLNPMRGGDARLGASIQPALRDLVRNTDMVGRIAGRAVRMIEGLGSLAVANAWVGNRPMLSDGLPVAGRTPIEGLYVHGGLGSIGMHAAPATARWLADAVVGGRGEPALPWLVPARFPGWA
jgi:glycine/D-amino acid oxidase-like deaminating enzyme